MDYVATTTYGSANDQWARFVLQSPLVSSSKTKPCQFSSVQLRRSVHALTHRVIDRASFSKHTFRKCRYTFFILMVILSQAFFLKIKPKRYIFCSWDQLTPTPRPGLVDDFINQSTTPVEFLGEDWGGDPSLWPGIKKRKSLLISDTFTFDTYMS